MTAQFGCDGVIEVPFSPRLMTRTCVAALAVTVMARASAAQTTTRAAPVVMETVCPLLQLASTAPPTANAVTVNVGAIGVQNCTRVAADAVSVMAVVATGANTSSEVGAEAVTVTYK